MIQHARTRHARIWAAAVMLGGLLAISGPATADETDDVCQADPEWKAGPANDFETCRKLWEDIGTPVNGNDDADTTPVCHSAYVLSHNNVNKTPDWVMERLTRAQVTGKEKRPKLKFTYDENICKPARAIDKQYAGSGFDRGHQAPSADFNSSIELMKESFILSNIVPQVGAGFNRHIWKEFEDLVRKLTTDRGELYVITGPINPDENGNVTSITRDKNPCRNAIKLEPQKKAAICDANDKNKKAECGQDGVLVPAALYKIIYDPKLKRANAYVLPNLDHRALDDTNDPLEYLKRYRTSVRVVEQLTGLRFLQGIPKRARKAQVEECVATMMH
jgi:endonuclease G